MASVSRIICACSTCYSQHSTVTYQAVQSVDSPACHCGFDFEDINDFFFNCPLFGAERTELLTNMLTLGITNVNLSL